MKKINLIALLMVAVLGLTTLVVYAENIVTLTVIKEGTGSGLVSNGWISFGWAIYCGDDCTHTFDADAQLTGIALTAYPAPDSVFVGWEGDCRPYLSQPWSCVMTMDRDRTVIAIFDLIEPPFEGNHGEYVKLQSDKKDAGRSDTGKPEQIKK